MKISTPDIKISVITVCYNSVNTIEGTIQSILNQSYEYVEFIIIDNASSDGTIDVIKKYSNQISYWISESDSGIYNAMNKGLQHASGDYIIFMNSGDRFYNSKVIENFISVHPCEDIISGIAQYQRNNKPILKFWSPIRKNFKMNEILSGHIVNHQATFVKRSIFKEGYDESYTIIADELFFVKKIVYEGLNYRPINLIVTYYDETGFSNRNIIKNTIREQRAKFYHLNNLSMIQMKYSGNTLWINKICFKIKNQLYPLLNILKMDVKNLFYNLFNIYKIN